MSTTHPSSASPSGGTHATQASARPAQAGQRKSGPPDAADLFATMLSLLSASDAAPLPLASEAQEALNNDPANGLQTPLSAATDGDATLAAMMQWAGLPQAGATGRGASATADPPTAASITSPAAGSLAASATPAGGAPDPMLQGMQVLARPEAPDAQTLAALSPPADVPVVPTETGATPTDAATLTHAAASTARPSAAGRGQPPLTATQALQQSHHDTTQVDRLQVRVTSEVTVALRSTVALDERFATALSSDAPTTPLTGDAQTVPAAAVVGTSATPGFGTDLSGQSGGDGDTGAHTTASDHSPSDDGDGKDRTDEDWAQTQESLDTFASPTLRQASLRVGEAGEDAIDIRLSLTGQELDLGFRTDNAETRAALVRHAEGGLSELLQRSGIQLGDVSVGSQGGQSAGGDTPQTQARSQPPAATGTRGTGADTEAAPIAPLRPRRDGNRPLDLFV